MAYDITATKACLEARLETLQGRLAEICATLSEPEDDDLEEQAVDWDEDVVLQRLFDAGRDELLLIRAALSRIDDGSYGRCRSCGKAISSNRLRALPEASKCLRCAQGGIA